MRQTHKIPNDKYPFPTECIERTDPHFEHKAHYVRGHGKSGYKGVIFNAGKGTYRIKYEGKSRSRHNTLQVACEAYAALTARAARTDSVHMFVDVTSADPTGDDDAGASGGGDAPDPDPTGAASGGGDVSPPYLNPADLPPSKRPRC